MSVWSYTVRLNDPSGAGGSADATLVYDLQQALAAWSQYIVGEGNLVVALNIGSSTEGRASGGPTAPRFIGTNGGLNVYESVAENELALSGQFSGASADISITVDPGYLQYLDLDPGLTSASPIPGNELNPISVFLHEVMHGFGMVSYYDQNGNLPGNYETNFDQLISKTASGAYFVGAHAEAVYGGPVPITTTSPNGENYAHFGNQQSDFYATPSTVQDPLTLDLMNGIVFFAGYDYGISSLDLAVLQDLGYSIRTTPVVSAHDVNATRDESFFASSLFSVSTAAHDFITAYQFWDSTADPTSGYWTVNGVAQPAGQAINATQSDLVNFQSVSGSDQLWVRVSDGVLWSDWVSFDVNAPVDHLPAVTAPNYTASHNQNIAASSLFSVTDQDNDTITAYQLWDSTSDPNSGYWVVNGVAQPAGQAINVGELQLSSTTFQSASGTDLLWVRAKDGLLWGDWKSFTVNAPPEHPPTITAPSYNAAHGQSIAATSLFSATDAESDPITAYQVWDSTADVTSGYWIVGGVVQLAGRAITITPSQLASASFQSGSGSDQLWVRATDGVLWSNWQSFNVNAPVDHAPVVVPATANYTVTHHLNIQASSLFSVSDADSADTITAYQFWDSTSNPSGGHWVVGGVAQVAGQAIDVTPAQFVSATFQSGSGSDHLWVRANDGIEWGAWQDFYVTAPIDSAPVVTAPDYSATHNQNIAASSLFSVVDAEHDAITAYQFWDSTSDPASGYWVVGGVAQPAGQAIDVTAAQFAGATFQSGSGSSDRLWVRAYDGMKWSDWTSFNVNAAVDHAPVVSATNFTASRAQVAATSLFSVSDADDDTITAYQFWDSVPASGHWVVDGAAEPAGQAIDVTPAQLASATFQSATGATDHLWVRANDGSEWSAWQDFYVTTPPDHPPVITAPNYTVAHNQFVAATDLFSATDPDGDPITAYQFMDSTDALTSGYWIVDRLRSAGQVIDVTPAQLATASFLVGSTSDQLMVRASDGVAWSDWKSFTLTVANDNAPIVAATDYTATQNQSIAAASLFSATDPDNDAITEYQLRDLNTDPGSGSWIVDGVAQPAGQTINVTPAQLSTATFLAGSGADQLMVRASDGVVWSDWKDFYVNQASEHPPVVSGDDVTLALGANPSVPSLFHATDADGDAIQKYEFIQTGGSRYNFFSLNVPGSNTYPAFGEYYFVDASYFNQDFRFMTVDSGSTSQLKLRAYDGTLWSDWHTITVTTT